MPMTDAARLENGDRLPRVTAPRARDEAPGAADAESRASMTES